MGSTHNPTLSRHVKDQHGSLEDLIDAAEAAQGLLAHPGWKVVQELIEAEVATINAKLEAGVLDSKSEYAYRHGRIGGLRAVPGLIEVLTARAERETDRQRRKHESVGETALQGV